MCHKHAKYAIVWGQGAKGAIREWGIKGAKEAIGFLQKERAHKGLINGSNGSGEPVMNPPNAS